MRPKRRVERREGRGGSIGWAGFATPEFGEEKSKSIATKENMCVLQVFVGAKKPRVLIHMLKRTSGKRLFDLSGAPTTHDMPLAQKPSAIQKPLAKERWTQTSRFV